MIDDRNLLHLQPRRRINTVMSRYLSGGVAIRYVLPALWIDDTTLTTSVDYNTTLLQ